MINFEKYKILNLPQFLVNAYGFKHAKGSSKNSPKLEGHGFLLVIKRNAKGHYTWFNINGDEKGKTILDIVSLLEGCSIVKATEIIDEFLKTNTITLNSSSYGPTSTANQLTSFSEFCYLLDKNPKSILFRLERLNIFPLKDRSFLHSRGISDVVIDEFNDKFPFIYNSLNKSKGTYDNIAFLLRPFVRDDHISFSIRNKGYNSFLGSHSSSLCYNTSDFNNLKHIFLGESMIDCMSHYQLHKDLLNLNLNNTVYISTEGSLVDFHIEMINNIFLNKNLDHIKSFNLIFDNDVAGHYFRIKLLSKLNLQDYDSPEYASYNRIYSASYRFSNSISDLNISFTPKLPFSSVTINPSPGNDIYNICLFLLSKFQECSRNTNLDFIPSFDFVSNKDGSFSANFLIPNSPSHWKLFSDAFLKFRFDNSLVNSLTPIGPHKDFNDLLMNEMKNNENTLKRF